MSIGIEQTHSTPSGHDVTRRRFLSTICGAVAVSGAGALLSACNAPERAGSISEAAAPEIGDSSSARPSTEKATALAPSSGPLSYHLPTSEGLWTPNSTRAGRLPTGEATVSITSHGKHTFDAAAVETVRPDIFADGHFSMFDVLAHLSNKGEIKLDYHFDDEMGTHIIDGINGDKHWWYQTYYSAGWRERNVFRMDQYPWKNGTHLSFHREAEERLEPIYESFRQEVARLEVNGGQLVLPSVNIESPDGRWGFGDVIVTPHDVRSDLFQPGVTTALDIILSLGEQGEFDAATLTWYERIGRADPVDSFWLERLDNAVAHGGCGFVYEAGSRRFGGFSGTHIHLPMDARIIVSPEYALWFWICL